MKRILYPDKMQWPALLKRPTQTFDDLEPLVKEVFDEVRRHGDSALKGYTEKFDGVSLDSLLVGKEELKEAEKLVPEALREAIEVAKRNIEKFHEAQKTDKVFVETISGVACWQEKRPIQKVGLYIPGGTAPLFSTVLMLAIPAKLAGCEEIILCTPPTKEGKVHPAILFSALLCGVSKIFKVGGTQAIAAMTFGTESVPKVYKLFGPGNQFVTVAKQVSTKFGVAIDMPAGPSELLVAADDSANASFVAADLLSQAEHGVDSQVLLVSTSEKLMDAVQGELESQIEQLPRKEIAVKAMANSKMIMVKDDDEAVELINAYGPEHYIVCVENDDFYVKNVANAGSVFIGNYTPESAGDYASGTNHTLPTNGYAKQYSGVNLDSFMKAITFQKISADGMKTLGKTIEIMAEAEGLQAHKNAVSLRLKYING